MKKITLFIVALFISVMSFGQMSGTYQVGTGQTYTTLKAAVDAINLAGVGGNILLEITSDLTEAANVWLGVNTGAYSLTIKPASGVTATITFTSATNVGLGTSIDGCFIIGSPTGDNTTLIPTNNVIIDGSNTVGGTSKDLTFIGATTTTSVNKSLLRIYGNNDDITIKNCVLTGKCTSGSNNGAIHVTNYNSTNLAPDRLTIENNTLTNVNGNGAAAIHISNSGSPTVGLTGLKIKNNIVYGRVRAMFISYTNDGDIYGNTISEISQTDQGSAAITLQTNFATAGTFNIYNNNITALTTINKTAGANNGVVGIDNQCVTPKIVNIYNNMITGMGPGNAATTNSKIYGIRITNTGTSNVYNNTIVVPEMTDMTAFGSSLIAGIVFASAAATEASPSGVISVKNNIIISNESGSTMKVWGIRRVGTGGTFTSDFNNIYANSANNYVGYYNNADAASLGGWQLASSQDANSKSKAVNFVSATDLSLTGTSIDDVDITVPAIGAPVSTDIFGNARHTPKVYMGAHEPNNINDTQTFTVTAPQGTEHVYIAGSFIGKAWDITTPYELTATANANEFSGTFPAHSDVAYKYLCQTGNWDYQEATSVSPLTAADNHAYAANDVVAYWKAMPKIKLNVSIASGGVPSKLYVKGGWDAWATPVELTASSTPLSVSGQKVKSGTTVSYTGTIGNGTTDLIYANTEYKYYTTDLTDPNWEVNADGSSRSNRWSISPLMNDEIARFTTQIATAVNTAKDIKVVIMRTPSGIVATFDGNAVVELYSINGALIEKTKANGSYSRDLSHGAYIIRVNGKATKFVK